MGYENILVSESVCRVANNGDRWTKSAATFEKREQSAKSAGSTWNIIAATRQKPRTEGQKSA